MTDHDSTNARSLTDPLATLRAGAAAASTDLGEIARGMPPGDPHRWARVLDRLSEECAELAAQARALPGRPADWPGHDHQILSGLRSATRAGETVPDVVARAAGRLADEHQRAGGPGNG